MKATSLAIDLTRQFAFKQSHDSMRARVDRIIKRNSSEFTFDDESDLNCEAFFWYLRNHESHGRESKVGRRIAFHTAMPSMGKGHTE